jgi:hypothetical protein
MNRTPDATVGDVTHSLIKRQKAYEDLIEFAKFMDPNYEPYAIHHKIAEKLMAVERGAIRRVGIFVPPAIGKSRLASEFFPAWCFGRSPEMEFIETSYDSALAFGFGRIVRDFLKDPRYQMVFPEVELSKSASAMDEWETVQHGTYKAEGVQGGLIGFHGHIAVIDDPFKGYEDAKSPGQRRKVWNWYTTTLLNRLRSYKGGPGAVIVIMQRFHDDDLGGKVEKLHASGDEHWDIINVPSIAEENDLLGREIGDVLLPNGPNKRSKEELEVIRGHNPSLFMAVHQQKPVSDEGDIFNPDWIRLYSRKDLPKGLTKYMASDFAFSKGSGDYTVHLAFGVCENGYVWLLDMWRKQSDILVGCEAAVNMMYNFQPLKHYMERVQMTKAVSPVLKKIMQDKGIYSILEGVSVIGQGGKASDSRAGAIAGAMSMGFINAPESAPWVGDLKWEISRFPNGTTDDIVDVLSLIGMNLNKLTGSTKGDPTEVQRVPVITSTDYTFDYMLDRHLRSRTGRALKQESVVIPMSRSWLDEAA